MACTNASKPKLGLLFNKDTKLRRRKRRAARTDINNYTESAAKALVVGEPIAIFYARHRNLAEFSR